MIAFLLVWVLSVTKAYPGSPYVPGYSISGLGDDSGIPHCLTALYNGVPSDSHFSCVVCEEGFHLTFVDDPEFPHLICDKDPPPALLECPSPEPCPECEQCKECPSCECPTMNECPSCECPTLPECPQCPSCECQSFSSLDPLEYSTIPLSSPSLLMESISGLFTMIETEQEKTDEAGMIALYCVAGLIILSLLILMIVFIYRKNKNQKVSSSATSSEFSNSDDQLNLTTQSATFDPPPTTFESFNPFEVPESEESDQLSS